MPLDDDDDNSSPIDDALAEIGRIAFPEPAICTSWVLISEWFGGEKNYWTLLLADSEQPEWRQYGLLQHALREFEREHLADPKEEES